VKKLVKPVLVGTGILLLGTLLLIAEIARFAGMFHSFAARFPGTCTEVPLGGSSEDIQVDAQRGIAYLSVLDRASLARSEPVDGTVMLVDLNVAEPAARAAMAYDPPAFRPHGLSLLDTGDTPARLFVISHRPDGNHTVEVAERDANGAFFPRETIADAAFVSPNAIVAVGPRQFYLVNDSSAGTLRTSDLVLRRALGTLVYFDGKAARIVERELQLPAGMGISPDGSRLYVGETLGKQLRIYRRDPASGDLALDEVVALDTSPDNINVDPDGVLWIAAHPKLLALRGHLRQPADRAPAQVLRFDPRGPRPADGETESRLSQVYGNDGSQISAASVAAHWRGEFLVGALFDHKVLICKPNP